MVVGLLYTGCERVSVAPEEELDTLSGTVTSFDPASRLFYTAVKITLPTGAQQADSVWINLYFASSDSDTTALDTPLVSLGLRDDATGGDILPQDGVYASKFDGGLPTGAIGTALVDYRAAIGGTQYLVSDSVTVYLPLLDEPFTSISKLDNRMFASVKVNLAEGDTLPDSVWTELSILSGPMADSLGVGAMLDTVRLVDTGLEGDSIAADSVFSRGFDSPLPIGTIGSVKFLFLASLKGRLHTAYDTLKLINRPPEIVSISSLDSVARPVSASDYARDSIFVEVDDPDGLGDVNSVIFQIVKPNGTLGVGLDGSTSFDLHDDGVYTGEKYFDHTANDGIYSGGVSFGLGNELGTYTLRFVAQDLSNALSDTAKFYVVLY